MGADASTNVPVTLSGEGVAGGSLTVSGPPSCWWAPYPVGAGDPVVVLAYVQSQASMSASINAAQALVDDPQGRIWYSARCDAEVDPLLAYDFIRRAQGPTLSPAAASVGIGSTRAYVPGTQPDPLVTPADLAQIAREHIELPEPTMDFNPRSADLDGGTLVNLPTWFWVTDPTSLADDGTATVRAQAGNVWAEVRATTTGLTLDSDAGTATCTITAAQVPWTPTTDDNTACTITFTHQSPDNGWPVTATIVWDITWNGSDGTTDQPLPDLTRTQTVDVPVSEIHTVVTG